MRTPARDALWLRLYIIPHSNPTIEYAYRSGQKYGDGTYSVGTAVTLEEITEKYKAHWAIWKDVKPVVTRVYQKINGEWKYLAKHEFTRAKV